MPDLELPAQPRAWVCTTCAYSASAREGGDWFAVVRIGDYYYCDYHLPAGNRLMVAMLQNAAGVACED